MMKRRALRRTARYRTHVYSPGQGEGRRTAPATVLDATHGGARIAMHHPPACGTTISVEVAGDRLAAEVRWSKTGHFGVKFARPLTDRQFSVLRGVVNGTRGAAPGRHEDTRVAPTRVPPRPAVPAARTVPRIEVAALKDAILSLDGTAPRSGRIVPKRLVAPIHA